MHDGSIRSLSFSVAFVAMACLTAGLLWLAPPAPPPPADSGITVAHPIPEIPDPWPLSLATRAVRVEEGRLGSGGTLAGVLGGAGLSGDDVADVVGAAREAFDIRRMRAGRNYRLYFDGRNELMLFRYHPRREIAWLVARTPEGWRGRVVEIPARYRPLYVHAEIHGGLESSLARTRVGREGAIELAQKIADLYAWDVDFAADLRPGDRLDVVVQQRFLSDEAAGFGDILASELTVRGMPLRAVRFVRAGNRIAYFTPEGQSMRRTFLRSPVAFITRISSRFTSRRYHPILNVHRPHYGVDYVAPPGTPVLATADGVVSYVGSNGQRGRYVTIRHGGTYTSWYLHLSRFADGLRAGQQVSQSQIIGYVGKSGLATSYHLDYRLSRSDGTYVDPLKLEFPAAEPVPEDELAAFYVQRDRWIELLQEGKRRAPVQLAGGGS